MHRDFWDNGNGDCGRQKSPLPEDSGKDRALLMTLILILITDGGDEMLIMALLYILS